MKAGLAFLFVLTFHWAADSQGQVIRIGGKIRLDPSTVQMLGSDLSIDGTYLVTGGDIVRVFHAPSGELLQQVRPTPEARQVESGLVSIRHWAHLLRRNRRTIKVAFSPTVRDVFATAGDDGIVRLWQVSKKEPLRVLRGHKGRVNELVFSPNGRLLASADSRSKRANTMDEVRIWDVSTGELIKSDAFYNDGIRCFVFYDNETLLLSCNDRKDKTGSVIELYDIASWTVKQRIPFAPGWGSGLSLTPNRDRLIITGGECVRLGPNNCRPTGYLWIVELTDNPSVKLVPTKPHGYYDSPYLNDTGDHFFTSTKIVNGPQVVSFLEQRRTSDGELVSSIERGMGLSSGYVTTADGKQIICSDLKRLVYIDAATGKTQRTVDVVD